MSQFDRTPDQPCEDPRFEPDGPTCIDCGCEYSDGLCGCERECERCGTPLDDAEDKLCEECDQEDDE